MLPTIATTSPLPDIVLLSNERGEDALIIFPTSKPKTKPGLPNVPIPTIDNNLDKTNDRTLKNDTTADLKDYDDYDDYLDYENTSNNKLKRRNRPQVSNQSKRLRNRFRRTKNKSPNSSNRKSRNRKRSRNIASRNAKRIRNNSNVNRQNRRPLRNRRVKNRRYPSRRNRQRNRNRANKVNNSSEEDFYDTYDDDYYDDDYESVEVNFRKRGRGRPTEWDYDYESDERSVEQWYFDYYDYDLENRRSLNKTNNVTAVILNSTVATVIATPSNITNKSEKVKLANVLDSKDLLESFNVSDMTNIAALMTFFNNQELFKMTSEGQTHRKTFNTLVKQLGLIRNSDDSPEDTDLSVENDKSAEILTSAEGMILQALSDLKKHMSNVNSKIVEKERDLKIIQSSKLIELAGLSQLKTSVDNDSNSPVTEKPMIVLESGKLPSLPDNSSLERFLSRFGKSSQVTTIKLNEL